MNSTELRPVSIDELEGFWLARAKELDPYNAGAAHAYRTAAADLSAARRALADEVLTLDEAAEASGYSKDHLERLIRDGKIPNAGRLHAPRIRRHDVPRRVGVLRKQAELSQVVVSRRQIARAVVSSHAGDHDG